MAYTNNGHSNLETESAQLADWVKILDTLPPLSVHKFLSRQASLLCIAEEVTWGGFVINGATLYSFNNIGVPILMLPLAHIDRFSGFLNAGFFFNKSREWHNSHIYSRKSVDRIVRPGKNHFFCELWNFGSTDLAEKRVNYNKFLIATKQCKSNI